MKDKLNDLIPWLEKLLETLAKVNPNDDHEEVERRSQLAKSAPCLESLVYPTLISVIDRWKILKHGRKYCWKRGRSPGPSIRDKIWERSSRSWRSLGKLSSSIRSVLETI